MNAREFKRGDILEIMNEQLSRKAPCTCTVVGTGPRGLVVEHADIDEFIAYTRFTGLSVEVQSKKRYKIS